ncbi:hypothetical protein QT975_07000 [Microcoleus sp. w2-18aC4]|uniref:hypothetical protein n=1 Tax=unclassified Microcoleus TaxID=2642155 RepID=UPI002FD478AE
MNIGMRGLTIDDSTYIVRAQDYGYWADENFKQIVSRTYIEVLKFPCEIEVTPFTTSEGTKLIGYLSATQGLSNSNPDFRGLPKFIPFDDEFYDEKRLTYFGNTGLSVAKKEL